MNHKPVHSSNIESVAHDPQREILHVKFKNGGTYEYTGVSTTLHDRFMAAPSKGGFLHAHIKPHCPAKKIG